MHTYYNTVDENIIEKIEMYSVKAEESNKNKCVKYLRCLERKVCKQILLCDTIGCKLLISIILLLHHSLTVPFLNKSNFSFICVHKIKYLFWISWKAPFKLHKPLDQHKYTWIYYLPTGIQKLKVVNKCWLFALTKATQGWKLVEYHYAGSSKWVKNDNLHILG